MSWTSPQDIHQFLQRQWNRGRLLAAEEIFPLRIPLKGPTSGELADLFPKVQAWIAQLRAHEGLYRLEWRTVRHRLLGTNRLPTRIWVDDVEHALALIGRLEEGKRYRQVLESTARRCPELLPWASRRPLRCLELAESWERLLDVVSWLQSHPNSGLYIRQVDFPGVHTKFIEEHKSVLSEMLTGVLPEEARNLETNVFERRFGFRERATRVRFRLLDHSEQLPDNWTDISLGSDEFARFIPRLKRVFVTENEINYLVFPPFPDSLVIFGAGYSIEQLACAQWLTEREIYYWGDIDTHGLAILDQLRKHFPQVRSLLMDRATFLAHREHWVTENKPTGRPLERLTPEEQALYQTLCSHQLGRNLRLEQEIIRYPWVLGYLERLIQT